MAVIKRRYGDRSVLGPRQQVATRCCNVLFYVEELSRPLSTCSNAYPYEILSSVRLTSKFSPGQVAVETQLILQSCFQSLGTKYLLVHIRDEILVTVYYGKSCDIRYREIGSMVTGDSLILVMYQKYSKVRSKCNKVSKP